MMIVWDKKITNRKKFKVWIRQSDCSWSRYYHSYVAAIYSIIESINNGVLVIDQVVMGLMFLLRHSFELGIKACIFSLINLFERIDSSSNTLTSAEYSDVTNSHSLEKLSCILIRLLDTKSVSFPEKVKEQLSQYKKLLREHVGKINQLDKTSQTFRYPENKNKERFFKRRLCDEDKSWIDISEYIFSLSELESLFLYSDCVFEELLMQDK